jgi:hypothetical protein
MAYLYQFPVCLVLYRRPQLSPKTCFSGLGEFLILLCKTDLFWSSRLDYLEKKMANSDRFPRTIYRAYKCGSNGGGEGVNIWPEIHAPVPTAIPTLKITKFSVHLHFFAFLFTTFAYFLLFSTTFSIFSCFSLPFFSPLPPAFQMYFVPSLPNEIWGGIQRQILTYGSIWDWAIDEKSRIRTVLKNRFFQDLHTVSWT